jgi:hypothetical protein
MTSKDNPRRSNAKDEVRLQAVELRRQGWSVNDLAVRLGVSKSTAYVWVKHIPLDRDSDRVRQKQERAALVQAGRWEERRAARDRRAAEVRAAAAVELGVVDDRDLLLGGALVYLCEGTRPKAGRRLDRLTFVNGDPRFHRLFLRFLAAQGWPPSALRYRVRIRGTTDGEAAGDWWAERLGVPRELFQPPTIRPHHPATTHPATTHPATTRSVTGGEPHGCLTVTVPKSRELYWKVEGVMDALDAVG